VSAELYDATIPITTDRYSAQPIKSRDAKRTGAIPFM